MPKPSVNPSALAEDPAVSETAPNPLGVIVVPPFDKFLADLKATPNSIVEAVLFTDKRGNVTNHTFRSVNAASSAVVAQAQPQNALSNLQRIKLRLANCKNSMIVLFIITDVNGTPACWGVLQANILDGQYTSNVPDSAHK